MPALIFDCDGVLAESERDGHLAAFNRTFAEFGLPIRWSEDEYGEKLLVSGGKERVATMLTPELVRATGLPSDPGRAARMARALPRAQDGDLPRDRRERRPARRDRASCASSTPRSTRAGRSRVASTASDESVRVILDDRARPAAARERFTVFAGDVVAAKKPDPSIYRLALERLGATPRARPS